VLIIDVLIGNEEFVVVGSKNKGRQFYSFYLIYLTWVWKILNLLVSNEIDLLAMKLFNLFNTVNI